MVYSSANVLTEDIHELDYVSHLRMYDLDDNAIDGCVRCTYGSRIFEIRRFCIWLNNLLLLMSIFLLKYSLTSLRQLIETKSDKVSNNTLLMFLLMVNNMLNSLNCILIIREERTYNIDCFQYKKNERFSRENLHGNEIDLFIHLTW